MKKMFKLMLIVSVGLIFVGCASTQLVTYDVPSKNLSFKITDEVRKNLTFSHPDYKNFSQNCIVKSYIVSETNMPKYGTIVAHHQKINSSCYWNGLPEGYVLGNIKRWFKTDELKRINKTEVGNYIFSDFLVDNSMEITLVELWGPKENTFLIDTKGKFSKELLSELKLNTK